MHIFSPAKINIGLRVFHRRPPDGYHYINSIMVPISFGDDLEIHESDTDSFSTTTELAPLALQNFHKVSERGRPEDNLIVKTLKLTRPMRKHALRVHLTKRIPLGAGLGGGSSNAGCLLKHIQAIHSQEWSAKQCEEIALQLGADVPFFIHQKAQFISGIGEICQNAKLGATWGVLALSDINMATPQAYQLLKKTLQPTPLLKNLWLEDSGIVKALQAACWKELECLENDFEKVVFTKYPILAEIKQGFLHNGASFTRMSGSGSAIYALTQGKLEQTSLLVTMQKLFSQCTFKCFEFVL